MNKTETIEEINKKYEQDYRLTRSGRVYSEFMGKKVYHKFDELVEKWESFEREKNARENARRATEYIESKGAEIRTKSMYGSVYFSYKGYIVRISNHHWTSEMHDECDYNIVNYEEGGYVKMIEAINNIPE